MSYRKIGSTVGKIMLSLTATVLIVSYFIDIPILTSVGQELQTWGVVIGSFAVVLGTLNLLIIHSNNIMRKKPEQWYYSIWLILCLIVMAIGRLGGESTKQFFTILYGEIYTVMGSMIFGLAAFFQASTCYRSLRARNIEAFGLTIASIITMLMVAPVGEVIWSGFPIIGNWVLKTVNTSAMRAIIITISIGTISIGFRTILGIEKVGIEE